MKTTFVLSLEPDTAAFLDEISEKSGTEDPNRFINRLLRQERDRQGLPARKIPDSPEMKEMQNFVDTQIPSAG